MSSDLQLMLQSNKPCVPVTNTQQLIYLLVTARPGETLAQIRMGLNYCFILDRSGSMRGEKIERLKEAMKLALSQMSPDDRVAIVVFNDGAQVLAESRPLRDQPNLAAKINNLRAGGGTQMSRGMSLGLREVYRHMDSQRSNQALLLTDGQTYGDEAQCLHLAQEAGEYKIAIQALGLGDDWNEDLLDDIARRSGGTSDLIESPDEIAPFFTQTVERSQKAVVRNARLVLRLAGGVAPRQVWQVTPFITNLGYAPIGQHDVQVDLGELNAQEGKSLIVELLLPPRPAGTYRVAQVQVLYDLPQSNQVDLEARQDFLLEFTTDPSRARQYDPEIMNLVEKVTVYRLQTRALDEARMGNIAGATQKLRAAATRLLELGEHELAEAARAEAENLEKSGEMSSAGTKKLRYQTRRLTQKLPDLPER